MKREELIIIDLINRFKKGSMYAEIEIKKLLLEKLELQHCIDKAIKYINMRGKTQFLTGTNYRGLDGLQMITLLKILEGGKENDIN